MKIIEVDLILIGNARNLFNPNSIKRWRSKLFRVSSVKTLSSLPDPAHYSGYLDQAYMDDQLREILQDREDILQIAVANFGLQDNFYIRRIYPRTAVLSLRNPLGFLQEAKISVESFLVKNIYEMITMYTECDSLTNEEVYQIPHIETRCCLFDMNGEISDIIYNTENPQICTACKTRLAEEPLPIDFVPNLEKELRKIHKSKWEKLEIWIKKHPLSSMIIALILGAVLSIVSTILYQESREILNRAKQKEIISTDTINEK